MAKAKTTVVEKMAKHAKRQKLQKAKKNIKRNRDARPPRRNNWVDLAHEDADDLDYAMKVERIMARDENDRRKTVEGIMYESEEEEVEVTEPMADGVQGQVIEVSSGLCRVSVNGQIKLCSLRGSLSAQDSGYSNVVTVGDQVIISENGKDQGVVEQVLARHNLLARPDTFYTHLQNVIAANVDQLLIVASWRDPILWPELLDRYLITAKHSNIAPVICVNKIDLAESFDEIEATIAPYRELGYRIILTSAERGNGIEELRELLKGQVTVLAGLSGVGKSTLLTAVQPDFDLRIGAISEDTNQGRHTTTQTNMLPFGDDGYVIDTPGIREFGLAGVRRHELIEFYPELLDAADECRFSDCTHRHEPDCAVRDGVDAGTINATRYDSYIKIWGCLSE